MVSRYDVGEVKAYNGFQLPFEKKKKKKIAKTIGAWVNKYNYLGFDKCLLVKSLKIKK